MKFNGAKKPALTIGKIVEVPTEIPFKASAKKTEVAETSKKETPKKETAREKKARLAQEAKEEKA